MKERSGQISVGGLGVQSERLVRVCQRVIKLAGKPETVATTEVSHNHFWIETDRLIEIAEGRRQLALRGVDGGTIVVVLGDLGVQLDGGRQIR